MISTNFKPVTLLFLLFTLSLNAQNKDSISLRKIFDYYLTESKCYSNLEYLATKIGGRLSGSPQAAQAVIWAKKAMYEAGADTVYLQACMVPHWVRGEKEICSSTNIKNKKNVNYSICALGGSVATPKMGINAEVITVNSFEELEKLGEEKVKGKIVFYNVFFDHRKTSTGTCYGETVKYRWAGPSNAAKYGAVATIVRSMSSIANDFPHTGAMGYDTSICKTKIPCCAISFIGADKLIKEMTENAKLKVNLKMSCQMLKDEPSFNVVGEIKGSEKPNEIILAGGHLDAWDNGQGAHEIGRAHV